VERGSAISVSAAATSSKCCTFKVERERPDRAQRGRNPAVRSTRLAPGYAQPGRGQYRKYLPYAFAEQGVAMLSSVLRSQRAVQVNIEIMRAFVRLRQMLQQNADLARKLALLEKKCDAQFRAVFDAIRELMRPPEKPRRRIGFGKEGA
jgi:hypothetical protein